MVYSKALVASLAFFYSTAVQALPVSEHGSETISKATLTQVPSTTIHRAPQTTGTIVTSLELEGHVTSLPFITQTITEPTHLKTPLPTYPTTLPAKNKTEAVNVFIAQSPADGVDPFQPFATGPYPSQVTPQGGHPVPRLNVVDQPNPYQTNKFYANFYLDTQEFGTFTHPYSLTWSQGGGNANSWGMAIVQLDDDAKSFGPVNDSLPGSPAEYYINPLGLQNVILSAAEFSNGTILQTSNLEAFSANAILTPGASQNSSTLVIPMVQGMAFVTGEYTGLTPLLQSSTFFSNLENVNIGTSGIFKYVATLNDGTIWNIYAVPSDGNNPQLVLSSQTSITGPSNWNGFIQIAKNPVGSAGDALYDAAAGTYPSAGAISASVSGSTGSYTLSWTKSGQASQTLLMFALPHHLASFDSTTGGGVQSGLQLSTTTKGNATAVVADSWTLTETNLPVAMGLEPFNISTGTPASFYSSEALSAIASAASAEATQDIGAQTNLNSMYYAGKGLSKFASIVWVMSEVLNDTALAGQTLSALESAYALFTSNQQIFPLVYDTVWGGVVSSAGYGSGGIGMDFGNTVYNDLNCKSHIHPLPLYPYPECIEINLCSQSILATSSTLPPSSPL